MKHANEGRYFTQDDLAEHPYLVEPRDHYYAGSLFGMFKKMKKTASEVLEQHAHEPYDIMIGDDVSGRAPTLILHHFLRSAALDGRISVLPKTFFIASGTALGSSNPEATKLQWDQNVSDYIDLTFAGHGLERSLIVTEIVCSGKSIDRIAAPLARVGIKSTVCKTGTTYLCGSGSSSTARTVVGVEKYPPAPTATRNMRSSPEKVSEFRHFLYDYAEALYASCFDTKPAEKYTERPAYTFNPHSGDPDFESIIRRIGLVPVASDTEKVLV